MTEDFNIESLKKKKQKNVQEQNILDQHIICECTLNYRNTDPLPRALNDLFEALGINLQRDILLWHDRMPCGATTTPYRGSWLTQDHRFIEYEVFLDSNDESVTSIEEWKDITDSVEISSHRQGTGKTHGLLCIEVLTEINGKFERE